MSICCCLCFCSTSPKDKLASFPDQQHPVAHSEVVSKPNKHVFWRLYNYSLSHNCALNAQEFVTGICTFVQWFRTDLNWHLISFWYIPWCTRFHSIYKLVQYCWSVWLHIPHVRTESTMSVHTSSLLLVVHTYKPWSTLKHVAPKRAILCQFLWDINCHWLCSASVNIVHVPNNIWRILC